MKQSGEFTKFSVKCRKSNGEVGQEQVWCKVWNNNELMATSTNSQIHGVGKVLEWEFEPFTVTEGEEYKFLFYKEGQKDRTTFGTDFQGCFRVMTKDPNDGVGMIGSLGAYGMPNAMERQPIYRMWITTPKFVTVDHIGDESHLTIEQRELLTRLSEEPTETEVTLGNNARNGSKDSIVIGNNAYIKLANDPYTSVASSCVVIGADAVTSSPCTVSTGEFSQSNGFGSVSIGGNAITYDELGVAIGNYAHT